MNIMHKAGYTDYSVCKSKLFLPYCSYYNSIYVTYYVYSCVYSQRHVDFQLNDRCEVDPIYIDLTPCK